MLQMDANFSQKINSKPSCFHVVRPRRQQSVTDGQAPGTELRCTCCSQRYWLPLIHLKLKVKRSQTLKFDRNKLYFKDVRVVNWRCFWGHELRMSLASVANREDQGAVVSHKDSEMEARLPSGQRALGKQEFAQCEINRCRWLITTYIRQLT